MRIGNKIRRLREAKGLSQENMADGLGMSPTGYGNIERNKNDINVEKLQKIAGLLGVKIEEIFASDEKFVINNFDNTKINNQSVYGFPEDMKRLYEAQIALLEDKIRYLNEKIELLERR